ncbi:MAG: hypothetical protein JWO38_7761 [Gemmataceae bacterium]|nr:hypothetical protein [Gemmataceae bacterium]
MHRFRAWGLSAALAVGAGAPAAAADPPPAPPRQPGAQTTLYNKLFGPSKPKDGPVTRDGVTGPGRPPTVTAPLTADVVAAALQAEHDALNRRMTVCLKFRQVALDTNDEGLMRQVDDLERQATALYTARVTALGVPTAKAPPGRPNSGGASALGTQLNDETVLDMKTAARRLTAPAAPAPLDPAVRTAEARTPTDGIREVRP